MRTEVKATPPIKPKGTSPECSTKAGDERQPTNTRWDAAVAPLSTVTPALRWGMTTHEYVAEPQCGYQAGGGGGSHGEKAFQMIDSQMLVAMNREMPEPRP